MRSELQSREPPWAESFEHEAFFYAGVDEFLEGTVPFLREGLERGEPTLVAVPGVRLRALQAAVQADVASPTEVTFIDMEDIGRNPARIIPAWRDFLAEHHDGSTRVRGIGEPIWAGRSAAELAECQRHESLLNVAFARGGGWRLMCPYDTIGLPDDVIAEARCSHPWVSDARGRTASPDCRDLDVMAAPFDAPLAPPPVDAALLEFALDDVPSVRHLVSVAGKAARFADDAVDDLVLAAHEIATNSIRYAGGTGTVRVWTQDDVLVCEIADRGRITDPLAGRERPTNERPGGRGMWMANQLCDLVQVRTVAEGNVVRLHMRRR